MRSNKDFFLVCLMTGNRPGAFKAKAPTRKVAYLQRRTTVYSYDTVNYVRNISKLLGRLNCH